MSLTIRTLTQADLDAADTVLMPAYAVPSRKAELRRYLALQPGGWLLATLDGAPAGVVGATNFGAFAYIGLMAVHPQAQRRGIGRALMEQLLARVDAWGCPMALLDASDAGFPLYQALGFVVDDTVDVWVGATAEAHARQAPGTAATGAAGIAVCALALDDLPALASYDADRFGADRGAVLASYLGHSRGLRQVRGEDGRGHAFAAFGASGAMAGFLFAHATRGDMLGPWMADGPDAAEALLLAALSLPYGGALYVQAPTANVDGRRLLERHGFQIGGTLRHMRRGGAPQLDRRASIYGQASFAIG
jgi:GNAT superfamily N-acetyltransferase